MDILNITIILGGWFGLSLTGALAPGPLSAACVMQASRRGRLYGFLPMVGHAIVELGIIAAIIFTLESVDFTPFAQAIMIGFGGIVVIAFGGLALRDRRMRPKGDFHGESEPRQASSIAEATIQGAVVSILSPYFLIWWFAIGLGSIQTLMIELQVQGTVIFAIGILVYLVHISTDFIFGAALSIGTDKAVKISKPGDINWINVGIGVFQVLLGFWFIWQAYGLFTIV